MSGRPRGRTIRGGRGRQPGLGRRSGTVFQRASTPARASTRRRAGSDRGGRWHALFLSHFADQRVYRLRPDGAPEALTPPEALRYADFVRDGRRGRLISVREEPSYPRRRKPQNAIVSLDVERGGPGQALLSGLRFLRRAPPRPRRLIPGLDRTGVSAHALGRRRGLGGAGLGRRRTRTAETRTSPAAVASRPSSRSGPPTESCTSSRPHRLVESLSLSWVGRVRPCDLEAGVRDPPVGLRDDRTTPLPGRAAPVPFTRQGTWNLAALDTTTRRPHRSPPVHGNSGRSNATGPDGLPRAVRRANRPVVRQDPLVRLR